MSLKIVIVDDEKWNRANLKALIEANCPEITIAGEAGSVDEAIKLLSKIRCDLLFLDIEMPQKNGFDLLKELWPVKFEVIFCTAYDKYAIKAFKFNAVDYLLKPIEIEDLVSAIRKAEENVRAKLKKPIDIDLLLQSISPSGKKPDRIVIHLNEGMKFVKIDSIIRCASDGNYTILYLTNGEKIMVAKTLKDFDEMLEEYGFYRIHNTHLINLAYVKSYKKDDGGFVEMIDKSMIEVSRRRKDGFMDIIGQQYLK